MYVKRDFLDTLIQLSTLESVLIWGPRQVGKTTLLDQLPLKTKFFLDDLGLRRRAQEDPGLLLANAKLPCLIDEAQYAPNLFPEIKLRIDATRRESIHQKNPPIGPSYYLTGSNKIILDGRVKESLAGRCHTFVLHGLSIRELIAAFPHLTIAEILFNGGLPEVYTRTDLNISDYLNDYILNFVEKDIAMSCGIRKLDEFRTVLQLLAGRTGQLLNSNEVSGASGVKHLTLTSWIGMLERSSIVQRIQPFTSNLTKRLVKMPKIYFYDVGICARLQSQSTAESLWSSAQVGGLFENAVFSEIIKTKDNFRRNWEINYWRTRDQNEIDFVLTDGTKYLLLEAKLAIHSAKAFKLDPEARKVFPDGTPQVVVTAGGEIAQIDRTTKVVPIQKLGDFLLENF